MAEEDVKTLDSLLRARGRKHIEKQITAAVEKGLTYNMGKDGKYNLLNLSEASLVIEDRGPLHEDHEARYSVKIYHEDLVKFLVGNALEYHGPIAEQLEVSEFLERVEGVAEDIENLRNGVEQE